MRTLYYSFFVVLLLFGCGQKRPISQQAAPPGTEYEKFRPQFHFSPDSMWMNDPNGMVFQNGTYHLFYQYYPDSTVWGPMHWGHATSTDMIKWEDKPIALYPDELGYIFSGSAVFDAQNTSGFGTADNPPLVAIYTYHDPVGAQDGDIDYQTQGIAYSQDDGETWEKYENNPVLKNPGIIDFRDPKVRWYENENKWIMTLAVKDHIRFYSSSDLKEWQLESEFGHEIGAHGGVWECPDLFPLKVEGTQDIYWILIVSLNPGGPNGGSGTQYFIGDFDGKIFTPGDEKIRWIDYGPDNYAGVTWSNTGERTLFIGWMSNWKYAEVVPTTTWRSAMTIARELTLIENKGRLAIQSLPVPEFDEYLAEVLKREDFEINGSYLVSKEADHLSSTFVLDLELENTDEFNIVLSDNLSSELLIRYNKESNRFVIDRSISGDVSFHNEFKDIISADRFSSEPMMKLKLVVDVASLELFADDGSTVLTAIYFPEKELEEVEIIPDTKLTISRIILSELK